MNGLTVSASALFWGLQFAFLNPVLALLLVALYDATPGDVGWVLAVYNASGFVAALLIPAWADRRRDYLRPLLVCGALTLVLAGALAVVSSLPTAVIALVVFGGPAGVGVSLLFAQIRHSGSGASEVIRTRAIVSFAWVAGPPLATLIMGVFGNSAILVVLAIVAVLNVVTTVIMLRRYNGRQPSDTASPDANAENPPVVARRSVVILVLGFVALQATNSAAVSIMSLFVTERLGLALAWSGVALGVSALVEIPALLVIGKLSQRFSSRGLMISGCIAGIAYYAAMSIVADPIALLAVQPLNSWFFGIVAGVGLTVFQDVIPAPGLATGIFTNTRRVGAILSGPIIATASMTSLGYQGVFATCAVISLAALGLVSIPAARQLSRSEKTVELRASRSPTMNH